MPRRLSREGGSRPRYCVDIRDGDRQVFAGLARDEAGRIVCTATPTFAGPRLNGEAS